MARDMGRRANEPRRRNRKPRRFSLVRFIGPDGHGLPFRTKQTYVFLGEIPNMGLGHCVVADVKTGRTWTGYHTDNFHEIPEDET